MHARVDGCQASCYGLVVLPAKLQVAQHQAQAVDVVAQVGFAGRCLFGCHVACGAGRLLQHGMHIGVGKPEVDNLHMLPVGGDHDVAGLDVAVHHAVLVHMCQCVHQLLCHLVAIGACGFFLKPVAQGDTLDPFHYNAFAQPVHILQAHHLHYAGVLQPHHDVELLHQHLVVGLLLSHFGR